MRRKTFDAILTTSGAVLVVVLLVAGALLMWGYNFTTSNVHSQLAKQDIYFPTSAQLAKAAPDTEVTPGMLPYLRPYAGQQLLTGQEAEVYADHFIAIHLYDMPYHGVYSVVSEKAIADPSNAALQAEEETTFKGTTLRGLLLEAYAFSTFGMIALIASIAAFAGAALMLFLTILGIIHLRRVPETAEI